MSQQQDAKSAQITEQPQNSCKTQLAVCANPPIYSCKAEKPYGCEFAVYFGHNLFCKHKDAGHYVR